MSSHNGNAVASVKSEPSLRQQQATRTDDNDDQRSAPAVVLSASHNNNCSAGADHDHHSYQVPIRDAAAPRTPATPHPRSRSSRNDTTTISSQGQPVQQPVQLSLQDRLTATALAGTLELLKQVGGVTLSTTGALVAPPLHVTRTILLPHLWAAAKDYLTTASPVRLKDWFRIFSSSIYHVIHTLEHTETGHAFRSRLLIVLADLVECLAADTTRQCLLDGMSAVVKWSEAVHTPEFKAFLEQLAVTGCRWLDAASNGRNKLLLHNLQQAAWSACALLADPATTTALAEVTAYLCYALEMEQHQQHAERTTTATTIGGGSTTSANRLRQERNQYQRALIDKDTLDAGRTVEEVILSSLGGVPPFSQAGGGDDGTSSSSVPHSIVCDVHAAAAAAAATVERMASNTANTGSNPEWDQGSSSIRQQKVEEKMQQNNDDDGTSVASQEWHERARNDVNVPFLREGIEQRAVHVQAAKQSRQHQRQEQANPAIQWQEQSDDNTATAADQKDDTDHDVEDLGVVTTVGFDDSGSDGDNGAANTQSRRRQRATLKVSTSTVEENQADKKQDAVVGFKDQQEDDWDQVPPQNPIRLEGETASQHFHCILDEILAKKRKEAVRATLTGGYHNNDAAFVMKAGTLRRPGQESRGIRPGDGTVKDRLAAIRAQLGAYSSEVDLKKVDHRNKKVFGKDEKTALMVGLSVVLVVVFLWLCLGCYGLYVFFHPASLRGGASSAHMVSVPASHEIVIRVVKEVVHVNQDGKELGRGKWTEPTEVTAEEYQRVAQCVAAVYN